MIKYSICLHTLIPVRIQPSERAEMVTQILFGEIYVINDTVGNWTKILAVFDNYEGWIDKKLNHEISEQLCKQIELSNVVLSHKPLSFLRNGSKNKIIPLVAGSSLPFINEAGEFIIDTQKFEYACKINALSATGENIVHLAKQFENAPYLWGGRTVLGVDCSGLTQLVYKIIGVALHRDASMQFNQGEAIGSIADAETGDIAFFDNNEGRIIHVGILMNNSEIIHASGWVKIDRIDHQGIFNTDLNAYSHKLSAIKRVINYPLVSK